MIQKDLGPCKLFVDSDEGRILVQNAKPILSIIGLEFLTNRKKFSRIDVEGYQAKMFLDDDELLVNELGDFMLDLTNLVQHHLDTNSQILNKKAFLEMLLAGTRKFIEDNY